MAAEFALLLLAICITVPGLFILAVLNRNISYENRNQTRWHSKQAGSSAD